MGQRADPRVQLQSGELPWGRASECAGGGHACSGRRALPLAPGGLQLWCRPAVRHTGPTLSRPPRPGPSLASLELSGEARAGAGRAAPQPSCRGGEDRPRISGKKRPQADLMTQGRLSPTETGLWSCSGVDRRPFCFGASAGRCLFFISRDLHNNLLFLISCHNGNQGIIILE